MNKQRRNKSAKSTGPVHQPREGYGNKPLSDPTGLDFNKTIPEQLKNYVGVNPNKSEWTTIVSQPKKGDFYGKK